MPFSILQILSRIVQSSLELWAYAQLVDIVLLNEEIDFKRIIIASKIIIVASFTMIIEIVIVAYFIVVIALLKIILITNN